MKKILPLFFLFAFISTNLNAQNVEFVIESPSTIAGSYAFTSSHEQAGWGGPDLSDTSNAVMDTLMLVEDGTPGVNPQGVDSTHEGCSSLINDLTGKIAVIYRNTCEFGVKALNAQNAGAVAAIIVNREDALVGMLPGGSGGLVTIPCIFVSGPTGTTIINEMANGPVVGFIGSRIYSYNLSIKEYGVVRPKAATIPTALAQDASEYSVEIGAWVNNNGVLDNDVALQAVITKDNDTLYNQSSVFSNLIGDDSVYISFPTFSQAVYDTGMYTLTYSANQNDSLEGYPSDNILSQNFHISNDKYSPAPLDSNEIISPNTWVRLQDGIFQNSLGACIAFMDPNASRLTATGLNFATYADNLNGFPNMEARLILGQAYKWNDNFNNLDDLTSLTIAPSSLDPLSAGSYFYPSDSAAAWALRGEEVELEFDDPVPLEDSARYLFCAYASEEEMRFGYSTTDYTQNTVNIERQPIWALTSNGAFEVHAFGVDITPAISLNLVPNTTSVEENNITDLKAYPNPATTFINVPLDGIVGNGILNILDLTGKLVSTMNVNVNNTLTIDVSTLSNGTYSFNLKLEDGQFSRFNVVVNR